jgi:hypothetical protein
LAKRFEQTVVDMDGGEKGETKPLMAEYPSKKEVSSQNVSYTKNQNAR